MIRRPVFADYYQIHLFDEGSTTDLSDVWTDKTAADQLAAGGDAMVVGTVVNVSVSVDVEILDQPPADDWAESDHAVEGSLHVPSGRMVIMGCTDYEPDALRLSVPAGWLRVRVAKSNLDVAITADPDPDAFDRAAAEQVRIQLWPAPERPPEVLKRWSAQGT
jgi:hypothetical protein